MFKLGGVNNIVNKNLMGKISYLSTLFLSVTLRHGCSPCFYLRHFYPQYVCLVLSIQYRAGVQPISYRLISAKRYRADILECYRADIKLVYRADIVSADIVSGIGAISMTRYRPISCRNSQYLPIQPISGGYQGLRLYHRQLCQPAHGWPGSCGPS